MTEKPNYDAFILIALITPIYAISVLITKSMDFSWYVGVLILPVTLMILSSRVIKGKRLRLNQLAKDNEGITSS